MADKIIWAPWRVSFIKGKREKGCVFCRRFRLKDTADNLIVHRGKTCFVILNKYPYNAGHTMVVPNRHIGDLAKLSPTEAREFFDLTRRTAGLIEKILKPHAMNLGMNLGESSGAGIPGHIHMHLVPRWNGDTNFMPVIGGTKVISVPLEPIYTALRKAFLKKSSR
jgi:ATP adenylyltransferase